MARLPLTINGIVAASLPHINAFFRSLSFIL